MFLPSKHISNGTGGLVEGIVVKLRSARVAKVEVLVNHFDLSFSIPSRSRKEECGVVIAHALYAKVVAGRDGRGYNFGYYRQAESKVVGGKIVKGSTGLGEKERKQLWKCEQRKSERDGRIRNKSIWPIKEGRPKRLIEGILLVEQEATVRWSRREGEQEGSGRSREAFC
jgi:ribosomal protein L7/L12